MPERALQKSGSTRRKIEPPKKPGAWFENGFQRFLSRYLGKHFHSVAVQRESLANADLPKDAAVIIYANHPSWWDPLIAQFLNRTLFSPRQFYAPIDAEALEQYKIFEKLGFYGVKLSSTSGASDFLKTSGAILNHPSTALWITPEGRFADVRDHESELMPGMAHLCSRHENVVAVPLALEYVFWDERLPVCLVSLGDPLVASEHTDWTKSEWSERLSAHLRDAQDRLSTLVIARSSEPFENLLKGKRGGGWIYDTCRRFKAWITGKPFKAAHGEQFQ